MSLAFIPTTLVGIQRLPFDSREMLGAVNPFLPPEAKTFSGLALVFFFSSDQIPWAPAGLPTNLMTWASFSTQRLLGLSMENPTAPLDTPEVFEVLKIWLFEGPKCIGSLQGRREPRNEPEGSDSRCFSRVEHRLDLENPRFHESVELVCLNGGVITWPTYLFRCGFVRGARISAYGA